ncbi:hypothetical protein [Streptomyces alboniger]|uniref:Uncharacterized protein n=1 Tax=Streptomyces alboniger TaxID=132473 RepID=A0A5J6HUG6_STRAD|nr:hypothetical protein [Streptomyces alboniger]QEV21970.1 hypothetical protein CP975_34695 [Streptomyces alboniger]
MQSGKQILWNRGAQDFTDGVGGDDPSHAQPYGQLARDRGLAHPGDAARQDDQRCLEVVDVLPPPVAKRVLFVDLAQDRACQIAQCAGRNEGVCLRGQPLVHASGGGERLAGSIPAVMNEEASRPSEKGRRWEPVWISMRGVVQPDPGQGQGPRP